jgi:Uncharacterized protein conserved in bacteria (DUF2321)
MSLVQLPNGGIAVDTSLVAAAYYHKLPKMLARMGQPIHAIKIVWNDPKMEETMIQCASFGEAENIVNFIVTIRSAQDLADEIDDLTPEERKVLKGSINDLVVDSPRTELATSRFKMLVAKAGKTTAQTLEKIVVSVATEATKKAILG